MSLERTYVWRKLREWKILRQHARVAAICEDLIARYRAGGPVVELKAKKDLGTEKIIWQYSLPEIIRWLGLRMTTFRSIWICRSLCSRSEVFTPGHSFLTCFE